MRLKRHSSIQKARCKTSGIYRVEQDSVGGGSHTGKTVSLNPVKKKRKVALLLQGPIGPFFKNLQTEFESAGFDTKRVLFHSADALFAPKRNAQRFSGDLTAWDRWLRKEFTNRTPDVVVLFGSCRPAHQIARKIAQENGIEIFALEEGYLRSGYITCERGGNNHYSPLTQWILSKPKQSPKDPMNIKSSFPMMCFWGASFYLWREFTKRESEQALYHRETHGVVNEIQSWTSHVVRRTLAKPYERQSYFDLIEKHHKEYMLVPLQTPSDSQIRLASRGWGNEKLITSCLVAANEVNCNELIVFKTHPLDENAHKLVAHIWKEAKRFNVIDNVRVLQTGKMGELTRNSSGMIVINSTSAFSALHHRVPLLVLGEAIFRHSSVVTLGKDIHSISSFLRTRNVKDAESVAAFIGTLKSSSLVPGDFYSTRSQRATAASVLRVITEFFDEKAGLVEVVK